MDKYMDTVRKITNNIAIAGQLTLSELPDIVEDGYQTIVNLRSPDEPGFIPEEQQKLERLGLRYLNLPVQIKALNPTTILEIIHQLSGLPKPMLIHCDSGVRASIVVLMQIAIMQGIQADDAFQKVARLGLLNE